ncbi:unnamed protein product [Adineta steineri]|uniref:Peptidase C45 hydrolase domain-containing protein n=1 Tax=Adineta steineri TaxID=433720 RepID=A0A814QID2_9BILA|nr:unnamed protein product [Adineta steineri]CAF1260018.1 unnamed protein product [Adineta steineri]CAF3530628.1 unnamed protein product [Adineta steineri]CAF3902392.1 unnamed protein product [Adineta steineri]
MASSRIPLYRVKGTHYECAHTIGELTRESIRHRIADDLPYLTPLFAFVQTEYGQKLHRDFLETTRSLYPWYWDELRGLADGSAIPFEQLLVLNFLNETRTAYRLLEEKKQLENETGEKGCTTVLINRKDTNTLSLLHNEDHSTALYMTGYLVEADIQSSKYDDGKRESPKEKFIAYCYAGGIPGNAFGVNKHGFACTLNGLYPNFVAHGRLPRQIINRALLSVKNEEELDKLIHASPAAYGFCINGGFIHQCNYLLNYEIGPNLNIDNENYISKCRIINNEDNLEKKNDDEYSTAFNYLIHYNHYERLDKVINQQKALQSSHSRWQRGQELGEIFNSKDAICLLGDYENEAFPIFRSSNQSDVKSRTLCTIHINFLTKELILYQHNPKENNEPSLTYNLADLFV